eukprot:TRINITY_DN67352_c0_g1_i1.p1 TRINITY_DN67352_c0_g1~~TRINITY_DN67352_c0_g1_i1.p1  ORF type:complete len:278 (+),score=40.42 TRINITY_DN67352_c0_g1_i1:72-836(+)
MRRSLLTVWQRRCCASAAASAPAPGDGLAAGAYGPAPCTVLCWDLEATGPDPATARCVELAAVHPRSGVPVLAEARQVHRISDEELCGAPPFHSVWADFRRWVADRQQSEQGEQPGAARRVLLLSHGAQRLDAPLLRRQLRACGLELPQHWALVDSTRVLSAAERGLSAVQRRDRGSGLYDWVAHFGIALPEGQHRALVDARATWAVVSSALRQYPVAPGLSVLDQLCALFPAPRSLRGPGARAAAASSRLEAL